jgi:hypothetical protein
MLPGPRRSDFRGLAQLDVRSSTSSTLTLRRQIVTDFFAQAAKNRSHLGQLQSNNILLFPDVLEKFPVIREAAQVHLGRFLSRVVNLRSIDVPVKVATEVDLLYSSCLDDVVQEPIDHGPQFFDVYFHRSHAIELFAEHR